MPKDDERLQRNLNALERRERRTRLGRRTKDQDVPREPRTRAPLTPVPDSPEEEAPESAEAPEVPQVPEAPQALEAANPAADQPAPRAAATTDGLPPKVPQSGPPRKVQADHLAAAVAALRQMAKTRPGFDIVVMDASASGRDGTRITWVEGGPPRVTLAHIDQHRPPTF